MCKSAWEAFELAQHFFSVPVTEEKRHTGGDGANDRNHDAANDVSRHFSFVSCLRHLAFPSRVSSGCAQRF
jgi:hypothetical protein